MSSAIGDQPNLERRMVHAWQAGKAAADQGDNTNPFHGGSDDPRERVLGLSWRKGYQSVSARRPLMADTAE